MSLSRGDELEPESGTESAVDDPHVTDHSPVRVVVGVEDESTQRGIGIARRRWHLLDEPLEQSGHAFSGLGRDSHDVVGGPADHVGDLAGDAVGVCGDQIDLVDGRYHLETGIDSEVGVCQSLRLDTLGRIHQQQGAFACGERPRNLV